jgi:hypothetical protein
MTDQTKPELPPGPWTYMSGQPYSDWGYVRDANGNMVANTCPGWLAHEFREANPQYGDVRDAGPPQARAVAELLSCCGADG